MAAHTLTASQQLLLQTLPDHFPLARLDRLWIFPAREGKNHESGLFVVTLRPEGADEPELRELHTLRYQTETVKSKLVRTDTVTEEGRAAPERIDRVIAGVLARTGDDAGEPLMIQVDGLPDRWPEVLQELTTTPP